MVLDEAQRLKYRNCFKKRQAAGASSSYASLECSSLPDPLPALIPISNPSRKPQVENIHKVSKYSNSLLNHIVVIRLSSRHDTTPYDTT